MAIAKMILVMAVNILNMGNIPNLVIMSISGRLRSGQIPQAAHGV
jgi:hypothetical protein